MKYYFESQEDLFNKINKQDNRLITVIEYYFLNQDKKVIRENNNIINRELNGLLIYDNDTYYHLLYATDLPLLSVEDKLTYTFPNDLSFSFNNEEYIKWENLPLSIRGTLPNNINELFKYDTKVIIETLELYFYYTTKVKLLD